MYVATFYSYKGGVGRTMALANVAYLLAAAGKRVLVVDFDLEAPGLTSYAAFRSGDDRQGLVEYVSEYLDTDVAPDVSEYIYECELNGHKIWLMPAGRYTQASYAGSYSSINWQVLYGERDGFLLFEDMKQQWSLYDGHGFDYVLIDSRTGHTDIGGICTRQLPDAVVIMFVPTPQNIEGLRPIVRAISKETVPVRRDKVKIHFCPSNVPDLDDQESILKGLLDAAATELGYKETAAVIQHYSALELLQQPIFASTNPKSRLARQYETLRTSIVAANLFDREGALLALDRLSASFQFARKANDQKAFDAINAEAALIRTKFPKDSEIAWGLAELANEMVRPEDELVSLEVVLESDSGSSAARLRRANVRATMDDRAGAVEDLRELLSKHRATFFETKPAVELLKVLDATGWRQAAIAGVNNRNMDEFSKAGLLQALLDERANAGEVVKLAREALSREKNGAMLQAAYALSLIADAQYAEAMEVLAPDREALISKGSISNVFNYAVAEWGLKKRPPVDLFLKVLDLRSHWRNSIDANMLQCFSLCLAGLGRYAEALEDARAAKLKAESVSPIFDCWRYLTVPTSVMLADLDQMISIYVAGGPINPPGQDGFAGSNPTTH